jgi:hypothetical protein
VTSTATIVSAFAGMHPREPLRASQGGRWASDHAGRSERATPRQDEKLRAERQIIRSAVRVAASALACEALAVGASYEEPARGALDFAQRTFQLDHARQRLQARRERLMALAPCALPLLSLGFITYDLLITSHSLLCGLAFLPATLGAASVGATVGKHTFRLTVALSLAAAADYRVRRKSDDSSYVESVTLSPYACPCPCPCPYTLSPSPGPGGSACETQKSAYGQGHGHAYETCREVSRSSRCSRSVRSIPTQQSERLGS